METEGGQEVVEKPIVTTYLELERLLQKLYGHYTDRGLSGMPGEQYVTDVNWVGQSLRVELHKDDESWELFRNENQIADSSMTLDEIRKLLEDSGGGAR